MRPVTHDFDVITDSPAPKRHPPQAAEGAPQPDAEEKRRSSSPPEREAREQRVAE